LLNPPGWQPGWFAGIEVGILKPHIKNHLLEPVVVTPAFTDGVYVPVAPLDWAGSPRVQLGYRFDQGFGEVRLAYQSLVSDGTATIPNYDLFGDGRLKSRLNVNMVDLDYAGERVPFGRIDDPTATLQWSVGARLATVFFDSRAQGNLLGQRVSNNFVGAGPFVGLDQFIPLFHCTEFGLYSRVQGALAIGSTRQGFEETFTLPGVFDVGGATTVRNTNAVPILDVEAGLSWAPATSPHGLCFTGGYQFQGWWYLGQTSSSDAHLTAQGFFLRAEWRF
jgi:hypothetical protein